MLQQQPARALASRAGIGAAKIGNQCIETLQILVRLHDPKWSQPVQTWCVAPIFRERAWRLRLPWWSERTPSWRAPRKPRELLCCSAPPRPGDSWLLSHGGRRQWYVHLSAFGTPLLAFTSTRVPSVRGPAEYT